MLRRWPYDGYDNLHTWHDFQLYANGVAFHTEMPVKRPSQTSAYEPWAGPTLQENHL